MAHVEPETAVNVRSFTEYKKTQSRLTRYDGRSRSMISLGTAYGPVRDFLTRDSYNRIARLCRTPLNLKWVSVSQLGRGGYALPSS